MSDVKRPSEEWPPIGRINSHTQWGEAWCEYARELEKRVRELMAIDEWFYADFGPNGPDFRDVEMHHLQHKLALERLRDLMKGGE